MPASQVGARGRGGMQLQSHPKVEEHPLGFQPATQPQAPLCQAPQ